MYFYKVKGKQYLDLKGNFILSHNDQIVKARVKSAAPTEINNLIYTTNIINLKFLSKCRLVLHVIGFIWANDESLKP